MPVRTKDDPFVTMSDIHNATQILSELQRALIIGEQEGGSIVQNPMNAVAAISTAIEAMAYRGDLLAEYLEEREKEGPVCCEDDQYLVSSLIADIASSAAGSALGAVRQSTEAMGGFDIYCAGHLCFENVSIGIVRLIAKSPWASENERGYYSVFNRATGETLKLGEYC